MLRVLHAPFVLWLLVWPSCGLSEDPPDEVTRSFWGAIESADSEAARALASAASGRLVEPMLSEVSIEGVLVGESLRNEQSALVATTLVTVEEGGELDVTFHTHLVREDDRWKVDLAASRSELRRGLFVAGMREIGEAVGEGVKEIGDAIREGALELEEALREALDGIDDGSRL